MGLEAFPDLKIEIDDAVAGSLVDISAYVTEIGSYTVEKSVEEITAAGDDTDR